jgi:putative ABC transport system substrate-binding protein
VNRRSFITLLGSAAAWPLAARAQQPAMPVVGYLTTRAPGDDTHLLAAFREGLKEAGYVEGPFAAFAQVPSKRPRIAYLSGTVFTAGAKIMDSFNEGMRALGHTEGRDFDLDHRFAGGYLDRLPVFAEEVMRAGADVIVAGTTQATIATRDATKTIPIVCPLLDDPVGQGLIKSEARPGGNVTGLLNSVPGLPALVFAWLAQYIAASPQRLDVVLAVRSVGKLLA